VTKLAPVSFTFKRSWIASFAALTPIMKNASVLAAGLCGQIVRRRTPLVGRRADCNVAGKAQNGGPCSPIDARRLHLICCRSCV